MEAVYTIAVSYGALVPVKQACATLQGATAGVVAKLNIALERYDTEDPFEWRTFEELCAGCACGGMVVTLVVTGQE